MPSETKRDWVAYTGELARPLNILVYRRKAPGGEYHAHCVQYYGVYARGASQSEAIRALLDQLLDYLFESQDSKTEPMRLAPNIYQRAFYTGERVAIDKTFEGELPVRVLVKQRAEYQSVRDIVNIRTTSLKELVEK
jgi:hypothetical protein